MPSAPSVRLDRAIAAYSSTSARFDAAFGVAEIGRAGRAEQPAALLVEAVHQPPHLGHEAAIRAADLAERPDIEQQPLRSRRSS